MSISKICEGCGTHFMARRDRTRFCSKGCDKKGKNSPNWKGDAVSLKVLHKWIERQLGRPKCCSRCGVIGKVDLANISNEYRRDVSDWEWLCRKCHMTDDGRLEAFLQHSQSKKLPQKTCPVCLTLFSAAHAKVKHCSRGCANRSRIKFESLI